MQVPKPKVRLCHSTRGGERRTTVPTSIQLAGSMIVLAISSIEMRWTEASVAERVCDVTETGTLIITWLEKKARLCGNIAGGTHLMC